MSKSSLPKINSLRQSRNRRAQQKLEASQAQVSIGTSGSPNVKKKNKRGTSNLDKDSKDMAKTFEVKIEELRKSMYNEINRLEAMMENNQTEHKNVFKEFTDQFQNNNSEATEAVKDLKGTMQQYQYALKMIADQVKICKDEIDKKANNNVDTQLKQIQRKLIKDVVVEITTPMQRNFNVDLKSMRKIIEECMNNIKDHQKRHQLTT